MNHDADAKQLADAISIFAKTVGTIIRQNIEQAVADQFGTPTITKEEVAKHFRVTVRTIENWQRRGVVPYVKIGKVVRFKVSDIEKYWSKHFTVRRWGS